MKMKIPTPQSCTVAPLLYLGYDYPDDGHGKGTVYLNGVEFARFWTEPACARTGHAGKIHFNRGTLALEFGTIPVAPFFDDEENMLRWLLKRLTNPQKVANEGDDARHESPLSHQSQESLGALPGKRAG